MVSHTLSSFVYISNTRLLKLKNSETYREYPLYRMMTKIDEQDDIALSLE